MNRVPQAKKSLGQHFLTDTRILQRIVETAGVTPEDVVLEIGPGPGGLTKALAQTGATVYALEADRRMVEHLAEEGVKAHVIQGDALKFDYLELSGQVGKKLKLVANLPYNISGPLTARLIRQRAAFCDMTLMYQLELAQRLVAGTRGKARGKLSVIVQTFFTPHIAFKLPPGAFKPPPKVESAVVRFDFLPEPHINNEDKYWDVISKAFQQRRKQLKNNIPELKENSEVLTKTGLTGMERPEELAVEQWIDLVNLL